MKKTDVQFFHTSEHALQQALIEKTNLNASAML